MATYSVYDIKIENEIVFAPGPTAGYILSIDENGNSVWIQN